MKYAAYGLIPAIYLIMFAFSGGLFRTSAERILRLFPKAAGLVSPDVLSRALMILLAADLLACAAVRMDELSDTVSRGYLMRGDVGEGERTEEVVLEAGGEETSVVLALPERQMTREERLDALARTAEALPDRVFKDCSKNQQGFYEVREALVLPEKGESGAVSLLWMTEKPDILDWDGSTGRHIPETGEEVTLTVLLSCGDETREETYHVLVLPQVMSRGEALRREAEETVESENDASALKVILPEEVGGEAAVWSAADSRKGVTLLMTGALAAVLYIYAMIRRKEDAAEMRRKERVRNDPGIVSKLVLLTSAGLSIRRSMERIAADYGRWRERGVSEKPGYEEIVRTCRELKNGVPETEAYRNLGRRAGVREYRSFAAVISQNLRKGGAEMTEILTRMAEEAQEERKKQARIRGDEAGTKLLLPMLVMLVLVMAILMVPAFIAFF